jgi:hypothetical protein
LAPVVIVAVYSVLAASAVAGVNVAVAPESVTAPLTTTPPGPATVKVDVFIVPAFIASLNVAVMICVVGTRVEAFAGVVDVTTGAGGRNVCSRPHPTATPAVRSANIQIFRVAELRICFSYKPLKWRCPVAPPLLMPDW